MRAWAADREHLPIHTNFVSLVGIIRRHKNLKNSAGNQSVIVFCSCLHTYYYIGKNNFVTLAILTRKIRLIIICWSGWLLAVKYQTLGIIGSSAYLLGKSEFWARLLFWTKVTPWLKIDLFASHPNVLQRWWSKRPLCTNFPINL
jgi:hypothetical protein